MTDQTLKPWPRDAVMIVCATPLDARRNEMESVHDAVCRACGVAIVYDGYTMRRAKDHPSRNGRPVLFFCVDCAMQYEPKWDHFEDHRGRKREHHA